MEWDGRLGDWADSKQCKTPQDMADILLSGYEGYLEYQATHGDRELTKNDLALVEAKRKIIVAKLQQ